MEDSNIKNEGNIKVEKSNKKRKKHNIFRNILNVLTFIILVLVIVGTFISFKGYNEFKNGKEPKYYIDKRIEKSDDLNVTIYDFGLYRAEKYEDSKKYTYKLLPFFIK